MERSLDEVISATDIGINKVDKQVQIFPVLQFSIARWFANLKLYADGAIVKGSDILASINRSIHYEVSQLASCSAAGYNQLIDNLVVILNQ